MALADQIGSASVTGGQVAAGLGTFTNWTVERCKTGGNKKDMEELINEDGALLGILVYQRHPLIDLTLISKGAGGTAAQAATDFPDGAKAGLTGLTAYLCESVDIESSKSAVRVNVSLRLIGV